MKILTTIPPVSSESNFSNKSDTPKTLSMKKISEKLKEFSKKNPLNYLELLSQIRFQTVPKKEPVNTTKISEEYFQS